MELISTMVFSFEKDFIHVKHCEPTMCGAKTFCFC
jgi:hypothetical protein